MLYAARAGIIVTNDLPAGATERALSGQAFVLLLELLGLARLPFSTHFNARYGLREALCVLIAMCEASRFVTPAVASLARHAEGTAGEGRVPSARWFTGLISSVAYRPMLARSGRMFARSVEMMIERGMIPSTVVAALDMTLHPYHGKEADRIARGGPSKGGASRFETYATAVVASLPYLPHIWVGPVRKGEAVHKCVGDMLRATSRLGVSIGLLLVDRGFYSAAVMRLLDRMGVKFIMPVPMSPPIRRAIAEFKAKKRGPVSRYTINGGKGRGGRKKYTYNLIIIQRFRTENGRRVAYYLAFATNLPAKKAEAALHRIPSEYKKRWAIETGYRTVNETRARTKSNSAAARLFLFYFSLAALNVWAIVNFAADTARTREGLRARARSDRDRRAAAQARGRGRVGKRWQRHWRNVVTRDALFDRLRIAANKLLRIVTDTGRADFLAQIATA